MLFKYKSDLDCSIGILKSVLTKPARTPELLSCTRVKTLVEIFLRQRRIGEKNATAPVFGTKITGYRRFLEIYQRLPAFLGKIATITAVFRKFPPVNYYPYLKKKRRISNCHYLRKILPIYFCRCRPTLTAIASNLKQKTWQRFCFSFGEIWFTDWVRLFLHQYQKMYRRFFVGYRRE